MRIHLLFLIVLPAFSVAQTDDCPCFKKQDCGKLEIGLNPFSYSRHASNNWTGGPYHPSGFLLKLRCQQNAFRFGADLFKHELMVKPSIWDRENKLPHIDWMAEGRLGYERRFLKRWFRPFIGVDGFLRVGEGKTSFYNWCGTSMPVQIPLTKIEYTDAGISPAIGFIFRLSEHLNFTLETNMEIYWFQHDLPEVESEWLDRKGFTTRVNLLRASTISWQF